MSSERITILFPLLEQSERFLADAIRSVLEQKSPRWELLVGLDARAPEWIEGWFERNADDRIRVLRVEQPGLAAAFNLMMREAETEFVCTLLSDDRLHRSAIGTLLRHRKRHPRVDYFYSSRRYIDADGEFVGPVMRSRPFRISHFYRFGSPAKHLMCWRRELALEIGGMREHLSQHGCDDFDFPWRMAEANAAFMPIRKCLYEYRVHSDGPRLTTDIPLSAQVSILERMFRDHDVPQFETSAYLDRAMDRYLPHSHGGQREGIAPDIEHARYREAGLSRATDFRERGFAERLFFPHKVYLTRRAGPDGGYYASRMCGVEDPARMRQLLLFARPEATEGIDPDVFTEDDVIWHQQHLNRPGLVAHVNVVLGEGELFVTLVQSDLVQRIGRRRPLKTRVENRFRGWAHLAANATLQYAQSLGARTVRWPTARLVLRHCDPTRDVQSELFERIYDRTISNRYSARVEGDWWLIDIESERERIVPLDANIELLPHRKRICVIHDTERGLGHPQDEPEFVAEAERVSGPALERMLEVERAAGVRVTYNVVGSILTQVRPAIEAGGHALAFHSYEHVVVEPPARRTAMLDRLRGREPEWPPDDRDAQELAKCRGVDYRLKGYRPPQSVMSPGLGDANLVMHNFEWVASSAWSLGSETPSMVNGLVKIPVHIDDFDLHRGTVSYEAWEERVRRLLDRLPVVVIGLHDCYGPTWLPGYAALLDMLVRAGDVVTCDELAAHITLADTRWSKGGAWPGS